MKEARLAVLKEIDALFDVHCEPCSRKADTTYCLKKCVIGKALRRLGNELDKVAGSRKDVEDVVDDPTIVKKKRGPKFKPDLFTMEEYQAFTEKGMLLQDISNVLGVPRHKVNYQLNKLRGNIKPRRKKNEMRDVQQ